MQDKLCAWEQQEGGTLRPCFDTIRTLAAGVYTITEDHNTGYLVLKPIEPSHDRVIRLNSSKIEEMVHDISTFWKQGERYKRFGLLHKRGILMYGPPGTGKTMIIRMVSKQVVDSGDLVILGNRPKLDQMLLAAIREIEPDRGIVYVLEDIDGILRVSDADVISFLDGNHTIDHIMTIATTNYIKTISSRIINRPSRIDRLIYVGMPSTSDRYAYIDSLLGNEPSPITLEQLVDDTDGMTLAHIRELVIAVHCLGQDYSEVLARLKKMVLGETENENPTLQELAKELAIAGGSTNS